ncbi:MAG: hypothetical protein HY567_01845 [Candidatus Kerfeldbacteria bacterium]|nr:hypothetical protein [Candidatus Kerfeldbacteria bacterium]
MLEQLLSSRTRVKLLRLLFLNPEQSYFVREMVRKTGEHLNSIRREVQNLLALGLLTEAAAGKKKFYRVSTEHGLYPELKALVFKAQVVEQKRTLRDLQRVGRIKYLCLTGFFAGLEHTLTDILIVGSVNRLRLRRLLRRFQRDFDREISYTVMSPSEFKYRNDLTDRFLYTILESPKIVIVDKLGSRARAGALTV